MDVRPPPDEEDEIEEELLPPKHPPYGAYGAPMQFLHAARLAVDSGLDEPARVLAREALDRARKAAAAQRERLSADEEERARHVGAPRTDDPSMDLLDDLGFLAGLIERRLGARAGATERSAPG